MTYPSPSDCVIISLAIVVSDPRCNSSLTLCLAILFLIFILGIYFGMCLVSFWLVLLFSNQIPELGYDRLSQKSTSVSSVSFNLLRQCQRDCRMVMFMVFNATFNNMSVIYRGGQFYWWRKSEYLEKTTDLPQVTDQLHHVMLYQVHIARVRFELTKVIGDRH